MASKVAIGLLIALTGWLVIIVVAILAWILIVLPIALVSGNHSTLYRCAPNTNVVERANEVFGLRYEIWEAIDGDPAGACEVK